MTLSRETDHILSQERIAVPTGYIPGLDGLRAIAVLWVLLFHAQVPGFSAGFLGVDVFFVLSGFLITSLLMAEIERTGSVRFAAFLMRRAVRLFPALIAMLVVFVMLAGTYPTAPPLPLLQAVLAATYMSDYGVAVFDIPREISHTWSLAVEAKFYLFWPFVLVFLLRRVGLADAWRFIALAALAATVWRFVNFAYLPDWNLAYYRFDTRLSGLLLGGALAAALRSAHAERLVRNLRTTAILLVPGLALISRGWGDPVLITWGCSLVEVATAATILAVIARPDGPVRVLTSPVLVGLGRLSYGIYLWHYPVFRWMREDYAWSSVLLVGGAISLALAWLSFVTIERFALRFRMRPAAREA